MRHPRPQWEIVLELLRASRGTGVHTFELRQRFIGNPSQRIAELEARGHVVTATRERLNGNAVGSRYRLVHDAGPSFARARGADSPTSAHPDQRGDNLTGTRESLFDPEPPRPLGAYEEAAMHPRRREDS